MNEARCPKCGQLLFKYRIKHLDRMGKESEDDTGQSAMEVQIKCTRKECRAMVGIKMIQMKLDLKVKP